MGDQQGRDSFGYLGVEPTQCVPPCSTAYLLARLDEPEPFVDASCNLCEDGCRIGVLQFRRLLTGVACMSAKSGQRRRKRIDVSVPISRRQQILVERRAPGNCLRRSLSTAAKLHNTCGNQVHILLHSLSDFSEQLTQGHELRSFDVPVGLPGL